MSYKTIKDLADKMKVPNCIVLYGTEEYYIDDAVNLIKEKYVDSDYDTMNYMEFEKIENNFNDFYEFVTTFPFMSEKKVCVVKESAFLTSAGSLNKKEEDKVSDVIDNIDSCITIYLIKGGKIDSRKKLVKKLKDKNAVFELNKLSEGELSKYIVNKFKSQGLNINFQDADYIANNSGYLEYESTVSLYHVNNEVEKIAAYKVNSNNVTFEDIDLLLIKSVESNIFKLVDHICEGNKAKAFEILDEMLLNNTPEQFIIHMISRQYRLLFQYVVLQKKGYSFNDIMNKMKIKNFVATKLSKQAKTLSQEKIQYYMGKILEIDKKIKTGEIDNRIGLELITNGIIK
ncbi:MAG: DNA polymerase III subunit delta [Sedimentibacter sp.]